MTNKNQIIQLVIVILIIFGTANFFVTASSLITYDYDLDYSEGFVIKNTERLVETGSLYQEPKLENGFDSVKYTPLYYILTALISPVLGLSLFTGRLLNLLFAVGVASLIYMISKQLTGRNTVLIALTFFLPYLTLFTATTIRVDMPAVFFSLTGIYLFLKDRNKLSSVMFLAAFFTKQTFVAGFIAVSAYLAFQNNRNDVMKAVNTRSVKRLLEKNRDLLEMNIVYFSGLILGLTALTVWSPHALSNIFMSNLSGFEIRWDLIEWMHLTFLPFFSLTAYYLYIFRDKLFGTYFLVSLLIMSFQLMRGGAWVYAVIEPFTVSLICIGLLISRISIGKDIINYIILAQIVIFLFAPLVSGNITSVSQMPEINQNADNAIVSYVESTDNASYTEHIGYEIKADKEYSPEIFAFYEQYASENIDAEEVVEYFEKQQYQYIITYRRIDKLPLEDYIEDNYVLINHLDRKDMLLNEEQWRVYRWEE